MQRTLLAPITEAEADPVHPGWRPLAIIASAHLMVVIDTTVMFVALPSIQRGLHMTVGSREWVVTAYTLALAGLLLLGGRLADRFGARRTLVIGVAGFAAASALGGAAFNGSMLIVARAIEGAFGALLISSTKSLLVTVYPDGGTRAKVLGVFTATLTAGLAVGFVLGGVLTSTFGWRSCLYVNVVFSLVALLGAPRALPVRTPRFEVRIDLPSAIVGSGGMAALVYGLGEAASAGWDSVLTIGALVTAVVLSSGFVALQVGRPDRLLPLRVLTDRNRGWGLVALVVNSLSTFAMLLILTFELQSVMHYTALLTGLALVPFAASAGLGSAAVAPALMKRVPSRWLVSASIVIEALGLVPLIWLRPHSGYLPLVLLATVLEGLGTGLAGPSTLNIALRGVLPSDAGAAGAVTSAVGQLGSSVGAALFNTIAASTTAAYLATHRAAGQLAATVHGFAVAMAVGAAVLVVAAVPVAVYVNARPPGQARRS
jgi:EmrB/QacA subfamily drug resistance transporter